MLQARAESVPHTTRRLRQTTCHTTHTRSEKRGHGAGGKQQRGIARAHVQDLHRRLPRVCCSGLCVISACAPAKARWARLHYRLRTLCPAPTDPVGQS